MSRRAWSALPGGVGLGGEYWSSRRQRRRRVIARSVACVFAVVGFAALTGPGLLGGGGAVRTGRSLAADNAQKPASSRKLAHTSDGDWDAVMSTESEHPRTGRRASVALPGGDCRITSPLPPPEDIAPTFVASYPNSGARMTWNLVQALTGIVTGDEHSQNSNPWERSVTVKSHYPHSQGNPKIGSTTNDQFPRAVLMLRHPAEAIGSFHNFLYEKENDLPDHSRHSHFAHAPLDAWLEWRDSNFDEQVEAWEEHVTYWMERYANPTDRLVLTFESMVDDVGGPYEARALTKFLGRTPGVEPFDEASVECVWRKVIKYKVTNVPKPTAVRSSMEATAAIAGSHGERHLDASVAPNDATRHKHPKVKKVRPYTTPQLDEMLDMLKRVRTKFDDPTLDNVLRSYEDRTGQLIMLSRYVESARSAAGRRRSEEGLRPQGGGAPVGKAAAEMMPGEGGAAAAAAAAAAGGKVSPPAAGEGAAPAAAREKKRLR